MALLDALYKLNKNSSQSRNTHSILWPIEFFTRPQLNIKGLLINTQMTQDSLKSAGKQRRFRWLARTFNKNGNTQHHV